MICEEALTANGNIGIIGLEHGSISFCSNDDGYDEQLKKLLYELAGRGCYVKEVICGE